MKIIDKLQKILLIIGFVVFWTIIVAASPSKETLPAKLAPNRLDSNSVKQLEQILLEKLYDLNSEYEKQWGVSIYSSIKTSLKNKWAPDIVIANLNNQWLNYINQSNKNVLTADSPILINTFLWDVRCKLNKKILSLKVDENSIIYIARIKYLKNKKRFLSWLKVKIKNFDQSTKKGYFYNLLLMYYAISIKDYDTVIKINILLKPTQFTHFYLYDYLNLVSNIAKYSELAGKVNKKARDIIIKYYNNLINNEKFVKYLDNDIRGKCIIAVVKKYNLLNGKPKDGYYYPVNDMKIKVVAD